MGFEAVILNKVAEVLQSSRKAEFTYATLYVEDISQSEADNLHIELIEFSRRNVIMSNVGNEFAFDFTAD